MRFVIPNVAMETCLRRFFEVRLFADREKRYAICTVELALLYEISLFTCQASDILNWLHRVHFESS